MRNKLPERFESCLKNLIHGFSGKYPISAIVVGGSTSMGAADDESDLDVYVYAREIVPVEIRQTIIIPRADTVEIGNEFWEPGDEWMEKDTGVEVDVMYRTTSWVENELNSVLEKFQAKVGYSTAIWFNVLHSIPVYDKENWFKNFHHKTECVYPEKLKRNVVNKNLPVLRSIQSSYKNQILKAFKRWDLVSVNHRLAAFLTSYFDVLFAVNELPHPGEKRMLEYTLANCSKLPKNMKVQVEGLLLSPIENEEVLMKNMDSLVNELEELI